MPVDDRSGTSLWEELVCFSDSSPIRGGGINLALDELLLRQMRSPWIRWYGWVVPTVSIGYFSDMPGEIERPVVRRWTGGGLVEHGGERDYTFAIGVPRDSGEMLGRPAQSYREIHSRLARVFRELGVSCELADETSISNVKGSACFRSPVAADIVTRAGQKLVGGAQRRTKLGMLHQGSVQGIDLPPDVPRLFAKALCSSVRGDELPKMAIDESEPLAAMRYRDLRERGS